MTITAPPRASESPQAHDPEALIKEARAHGRRRRRRALIVTAIVVTVGAATYALESRIGGNGSGLEHMPNGPTVDLRVFAGHGRLAFVSHDKLWVLDGTSRTLRQLPTTRGFTPTQPVFSSDGKWLAYLDQKRQSANVETRLWIARSNGTYAHAIPGIAAAALYGWSPSRDVLAISAGPEHTHQPCPCYSPTTLRLVAPDGSSRVLAQGPWIYGAAWSPSGSAMAVGIEGPLELSRLLSYPVAGGRPTVWLRFARHLRLNGMSQILVDPAGWWKGFGIGFWVFGDGAIHNNDDTPLDLIRKPGAPPTTLAQTLSDRTTESFATSTAGKRLAVVADISHGRNGGRDYWSKKQVQVCEPVGDCKGLVDRESKVTLDPAWSPNGSTLAFIEAPNYSSPGAPLAVLHRWYADHRLFLYDAAIKTVQAVPDATGVTVPQWSADGRSLLYVSHNALWMLPALGGKPVEIASPLFATGNWPEYYAQVAWTTQFAWSS
jgi:hypothetical protein